MLSNRKGDLFFLAILAASLGLNVHLGWKVLGASGSGRIARVHPSVGAPFPDLDVRDSAGVVAKMKWSTSNKPTVLYVFTPSCHWCKQNLPNIRSLVDLKGAEYQFVGLSLSDEGLVNYVQKSGIAFPVFTAADQKALTKLGLNSTPQTIVVSPEGRVMNFWAGAYAGRTLKAVESAFGVELPGLIQLHQD
jgi:peroxiredoxin